MIFDTEPLTGAHTGQPARFGFWQSRGLKYAERCELLERGELTPERQGACQEEGIFMIPRTARKTGNWDN